MKKILCVLLALILTLALAACGGEGGNSDPAQKDGVTAPEGSVDGYLFVTGDLTVAVDAKMEPIYQKLGKETSYFEAASCAFEGLDKNYIYPHFEIDTYPASDGDRVLAVCLQDDLVATKEGLRIGNSKEDMERIYGTGYELSGTEYTYSKGGMQLKILVENGAVSYITYASAVLGRARVE